MDVPVVPRRRAGAGVPLSRDSRLRAVGWMLVSGVGFTLMGVFVKLAPHLPVWDKVLFRNVVSMVIALALVLARRQPLFGRPGNRRWLMARSVLGLAGVAGYFYSLEHLLLADATLLNRISPFFVALFAALFLHERLTKLAVAALALGFVGGAFAVRPRFAFSWEPALVGVASAALAGAAYTVLRLLRDRESSETVVFFFSFVSVLAMAPVMACTGLRAAALRDWLLLVGVGVGAAMGQFGMTLAYRYAPAAEASLYGHSILPVAAVTGLLLWGETQDWTSLLGSVLIVVAALGVYLGRARPPA